MNEGTTSLPILLFQWWYGLAYQRIFKYIRAVYIYTADLFSIKIIFVTLFAPWKRDVISYENLTLQQKFEVWSLNMASRFVGFMIKVIALAVYLIFTIFETAISFALVIIWPFYPLILIGLIYYGLSLLI
jgi:hypothetical protein